MACYVIGDVHGCFSALDKLLDKIQLTAEDRLIFLGDYVARGSDSLGVLRLIMGLPNAVCLFSNMADKSFHWQRYLKLSERTTLS